eukprot:tig00021137_g18981.t1
MRACAALALVDDSDSASDLLVGTNDYIFSGKLYTVMGGFIYEIACPPNVTISRVEPIEVSVGSEVKRLCGARMPDLRFLIQGNWSDWRMNMTQQPKAGSFVPMSLRPNEAPTTPEWIAAGYDQPAADGILVSITVDNPTDAGPEGSCSFNLYVREAGPPLCPGVCPQPVLALPIDPATCSVNVPDLHANLTLLTPDCIPPRPLDASSYEVVQARGGAMEPLAVGRWDVAGPPPHVKEARIRHRDFPDGPSCSVRVVAYVPREPPVSWVSWQDENADARASSAISALGPDPQPADWARHFQATVSGPCSTTPVLLQHCESRVRVEMNPKLGLAGPDVDASGNLTSGATPGRRAWSLAMGSEAAPSSITALFSREVPDAYLSDFPDIAPGEVLRAYHIGLACTFNKGLPPFEGHKIAKISLAPVRVEIRKPAPQLQQ